VGALTRELVITGRKVVGGQASGEALVTNQPISFMGGVDPMTGIVVEKGHDLEGSSIAGKVLVFPTGKGSTGGSYMIYEMSKRGTGPAAILNLRSEPVVAVGAVISRIPMIDKLSRTSFQDISSGDHVKVDACKGEITIIKHD